MPLTPFNSSSSQQDFYRRAHSQPQDGNSDTLFQLTVIVVAITEEAAARRKSIAVDICF